MKEQEKLLFIKQGLALKNLLQKTDSNGSHQKQIAEIENKIKKARQQSRA